MDRRRLWLIPITPPIIAFIPAMSGINVFMVCGMKNRRIDRGASFCHVDKIIQDIHEIDAITDGNQK